MRPGQLVLSALQRAEHVTVTPLPDLQTRPAIH